MAISTVEHSKVALGAIHKLHNLSYADAAARVGAVGLTVDNDYQVARQEDNDTFWILLDYSGPTWLLIETGGATGLWAKVGTLMSPLTATDTLTVGTGGTAAPSYSFGLEPTTGMYRIAAGLLGFAIGGVNKATLTATSFNIVDNISLTGGGSILTTANGNIDLIPNGTGITAIGGGAGSHGLNAPGDLFVSGELEVNGASFFDADCKMADNRNFVFGDGSDAFLSWRTNQTVDALCMAVSPTGNTFLIYQNGDQGTNFGAPSYTDPTQRIQSADATEVSEYGLTAWNNQTIGGGAGSYCGMKSIEEEVTIAVGVGAAGVNTAGNLAPATARIIQIVSRVTQAPGGGATLLNIGRTNGANPDEYADITAVALGTTTIANDDGDGTAIPHWQTAADTLVLTTDANVTVSDMKVRVVVFYEEITVPTA